MTRELPLELLACPTCHGALASADGALRCEPCAARFSVVGGIPELIPAEMLSRLREGGDPAWARWREAIRGLESWRAARAGASSSKSFDDGTSDRTIGALFERAQVRGVVVDVGAKDGAKSRWMKGLTQYIGVDPLPVRASTALPDHAMVVRGLAEALPLRTRSADAVVSISAFDYFHDGYVALEEMARVLKPGGRFALLVSVVTGAVASARGGRTRRLRVTSALRALKDVGLTAGAGLVGAALIDRDRPHTHYYTRTQITAMVGVKFTIEGTEESPQAASTILYIHGTKKRTARLPVLR